MAWLGIWVNRIKITIDRNDIDAALSNFPVLIYLSASSGHSNKDVSCVFDELGSDANRRRIAVTQSDGVTECYVEVEKWDHANEQAWLWVKIPDVNPDVDTDLYLYYDSTHADNTNYVGDPSDAVVHNVWDTNFKLVTHMRDDPDTSHIRDSTHYGNYGTKLAAGEPAVTTAGQIDDAQDFDGTDDFITIGHSSSLNILTGQATLKFWFKRDSVVAVNQILVDKNSPTPEPIFIRLGNDHKIYIQLFFNAGNYWFARNTTLINDTDWHRLVVIFDYDDWSNSKIYLDNILETLTTETQVGTEQTMTNTGILSIGASNTGGSPFNGIIDEIQISDIARTPAWRKASYESERDELLDFGTCQKIPIDRFQEEGTDFRETKFGATWET